MYPEWMGLWKTDNLPKRVLLVRLDNIGDIVMLSPAIRAIKGSFPSAHLTLMASPAGSQSASLLPWVDNTLTWRAVWQDVLGQMHQDPERELDLVEDIKNQSFDAAFIFTSFSQSPYPPAYICYLAGVPVRIGQSKEFGGSVLTHWRKSPPDSGHQADRNLALLEIAGLPFTDRSLELHIPDKEKEETYDLLSSERIGRDQPYIVAAPGASCSSRRYNIHGFINVIEHLSETCGLPVLIVGSEREKLILEPLLNWAQENKRVISLVGKTNVVKLGAIIQDAEMVLTNNSASLHIADAFRTPIVVLYSGTEYESQWKPRSSPFRLLRRPTDCSPCYAFQCPYSMECLDIPPEEVVEHALDLLNESNRILECKSRDQSIYPT